MKRCPPVGAVLLVLCTAAAARADDEPCPADRPAVGTLLAAEGRVSIAGRALAAATRPLCADEPVEVGAGSRATLRLDAADTVLRLDAGSGLVALAPDDPGSGVVRLLRGTLYFLSQVRRTLTVETPYVTVGIDGTELLVEVRPGLTDVLVLDGRARLSDRLRAPVGDLLTGEEARVGADGRLARRGAPAGRGEPLRAMARDRLGWTLWYPAVIESEAARHPGIAAAAALLARGRVAEAEARLARLGAQGGEEAGLASGLRAVIALARADLDGADAAAARAVAAAPEAAGAFLARSYARQARGELEPALEDARRATRIAPTSPLAVAREAELRLSLGDLRGARRAAERALQLDPSALAHTVLGFVELAGARAAIAERRFRAALAVDPSSPAAHLGLGLALVRQGRPGEGRAAIEAAAALDPRAALPRTYLGRALAEESRIAEALGQLELAKAFDPSDPTPWLAAARIAQLANRPVEALREAERSIALNDARAPFRSRLLLDQDRAVRGAALARIFQDLGFDRAADLTAARALEADPASAAAHRFLAESLARRPRHEVAQVSELLQSQLLDPLAREPVRPQLLFAGLDTVAGGSPFTVGPGEYGALLDRDRAQLALAGLAGDDHQLGGEAVVGLVHGRASLSGSIAHEESEGFRANNDFANDLLTAFGQLQLAPELSIQLEYRGRRTERGDLELRFDPDDFGGQRNRIDQDIGRVGVRWAPAPGHVLLASGIWVDRDEEAEEEGIGAVLEDRGPQAEAQYLLTGPLGSLVLGGGIAELDTRLDYRNAPPALDLPESTDDRLLQTGLYGYLTWRASRRLTVTGGLSVDRLSRGGDDDGQLDPKLGLSFDLTDAVRLRAAAFRTLKRPIAADQTLEPTTVAGFNQLFDDLDGTDAWRYGVGLDWRVAPDLLLGIELSQRDLHAPISDAKIDEEPLIEEDRREQEARAFAYWTPGDRLALSLAPELTYFDLGSPSTVDVPRNVWTVAAPLAARWFHPDGLYAGLQATFLFQDVEQAPGAGDSGSSTAVLLDALAGWRRPGGGLLLGLEVQNLLDTEFDHRDDNYLSATKRNARFRPDRRITARLAVRF